MTQQDFLTALTAFVLLPDEVRTYAIAVSADVTDEERAELLKTMQAEYGEIEKLEAQRSALFDGALKELKDVQRKHMPAIEAADKQGQADDLARQIDEA